MKQEQTKLNYDFQFAITLRGMTWIEYLGPEMYQEKSAPPADGLIDFRTSIQIAQFDGSEYMPTELQQIAYACRAQGDTRYTKVTRKQWKDQARNWRLYMTSGHGLQIAAKKKIVAKLPTDLLIDGDAETREVHIDGKLLRPEASQKLRNHSPDGFNWGYGGSGPAQLALAILLKYLSPEDAMNLYQDFKFKVVASWPGAQDFEVRINLQKIIETIITKQQQQQQS